MASLASLASPCAYGVMEGLVEEDEEEEAEGVVETADTRRASASRPGQNNVGVIGGEGRG